MGSRVRSLVVGVLLGVGLLSGFAYGSLARRAPPTPTVPGTSHATTFIDVHVAGWVVSPGVVSVPVGSIVAVAIDMAGGFRPGASTDGVNLAAEVFDGEQIVVPGPDLDGGPIEDGVISLNRATAAELEVLPGVGPVLAGRIVAHREANGRFSSVDDLLEVPGIGEAKLASIRDLVRP